MEIYHSKLIEVTLNSLFPFEQEVDRRMASSRMFRLVALVRIDVSEELSASIMYIRVVITRINLLPSGLSTATY
jgi:hypothetical protein